MVKESRDRCDCAGVFVCIRGFSSIESRAKSMSE